MVKKALYFIFGIPITLIALLGVFGSMGDKSGTSPMMVFVSILALGLLLIFFGVRTKTGNKRKQELETSINSGSERSKKQNQINHLKATHAAGLPLAENTDCIIQLKTDKFCFTGGGNEFELSYDKVTSFDVKTDEEIQNQCVSSIGGAVGGALLFGPLGAIVGGRAKTKKTKTLSYYVIFTYLKDQHVEYISFEISDSELSKAKDFKQVFDSKFRKNNTAKIEL